MSQYGDVVDVRFPSLKFNTHRRFCYVQFKLPSQARAATQLDGRMLDGKLDMIAKLSDPASKQDRQGPMHEGRELYIANVDWSATKRELKDAFSPFGKVESVRIPLKVDGKSKGIAFVIFSDKVSRPTSSNILLISSALTSSQESAKKALEMNLTRFKSRVISVTPSTNDTAKRQATTIINPATSRSSYSPTPDPNNPNRPDIAAAESPVSQATIARTNTEASSDKRTRTIALMNVPDTYTSDRVRVLAEAHGALVKLQLRPGRSFRSFIYHSRDMSCNVTLTRERNADSESNSDHRGAIIEYVNTASAGKAGLALDGHEIEGGRKLRVGTVPELMNEKAEVKSKKDALLQPTMPIRRPNQPGSKRGGRGGLGFKRGDSGATSSLGAAKNNADFKAMFLKEKGEEG